MTARATTRTASLLLLLLLLIKPLLLREISFSSSQLPAALSSLAAFNVIMTYSADKVLMSRRVLIETTS
jgi:hypothetical protein